jgi:hypothetical protein
VCVRERERERETDKRTAFKGEVNPKELLARAENSSLLWSE